MAERESSNIPVSEPDRDQQDFFFRGKVIHSRVFLYDQGGGVICSADLPSADSYVEAVDSIFQELALRDGGFLISDPKLSAAVSQYGKEKREGIEPSARAYRFEPFHGDREQVTLPGDPELTFVLTPNR